jgi:hypothetical protein
MTRLAALLALLALLGCAHHHAPVGRPRPVPHSAKNVAVVLTGH